MRTTSNRDLCSAGGKRIGKAADGMNITLIGMPGSGKSTVGVVLAKLRGVDFVDADLVIQRREKMRLQQILDSRGLDAFLDAEQAAICSITQDHTVIAPGGSVIARQASMEHLRRQGPVVYLRLPLEELKMRLGILPPGALRWRPGRRWRICTQCVRRSMRPMRI